MVTGLWGSRGLSKQREASSAVLDNKQSQVAIPCTLDFRIRGSNTALITHASMTLITEQTYPRP